MNVRLALICVFLCVNSLRAQDVVQYIGIEHGLSNNAVTSIYRDHNGFMWFGTYDGLNRYDGYSFTVFRNIIGDSTSLGDDHVSTIEGDANHNLWVGCEKGVYLYNPARSKFTSLRFKSSRDSVSQQIMENVPVVRSIEKGSIILVGVTARGLLVFKNGSQTGIQVPLMGSGDKEDYSVSSIAWDSTSESAWVMVQNKGLYQYSLKTNRLRLVNTSIKKSDCLEVDRAGNLWLGNDDGLFRYDKNANLFSRNILPSRYRVMKVFQDRPGRLWIASDGGGLWYMPVGSSQPQSYPSSGNASLINSNAVYSIYEDDDGRKWIGTLRGGVNLIQPFVNSFKTIAYNPLSRPNPMNNFVLSFCEDERNNVWIGTDGAGLRYWNRQKNQNALYVHDPGNTNSLSSNFITGICRDAHNDIWISTWFGGINRLKNGSQAFEHFRCFNPRTNSEEKNVWFVYEDAQKVLWASTTNDGCLYRFNEHSQSFELFDENIVNVQCLVEDSIGNLWAGNYNFLIRVDRLNKQHRVYKIGRTVRCIHEDRNKNFWVGTDGGGLLLFDRIKGTYRRFTSADGLPSNSILRILEDKNGNLWLSTYNGLCKFNTVSRTCRNFSQSDGLQSNQFSFNAALGLNSGEFLFGGIRGFNIFWPDSVYDKRETPKVFLTGLKINNTPVEENDTYVTRRTLETVTEIEMPFKQAILSLDYVALDYTGTDKIKYAYFLEGWDKNWNYVNNVRSVNYSRLQEGTYVFKVRVTNSDGIWSKDVRLLQIIILPPWYRTWWAYLLYLTLCLAVIYLYTVYSKRQERLRYEVKLARMEKEKERELTDKKLSFFTYISHEFRTPLTLIINPIKELVSSKNNEGVRKDILMVYRNARRLLSLVDQLLLFRKVDAIDQQMRIEKFDLLEACREVYLSFSHYALSKKIDFIFQQIQDGVFVYGDREKIEIILFNLVSNAFKHTPDGGTITLAITETASHVDVSVKDTGNGIPPHVAEQIFSSFYQADNRGANSQTGFGIGLYVSKKLAMAHFGSLGFTSEVNKGADFHLCLLKGKEHFGSLPVIETMAGENCHNMLQELVEDVRFENNPEETRPGVPARSEVIDQLTSQLPSMLIVDDNAEIRAYIKKIFAASFNVHEADNGDDGYELVLKEVPDIIISDIMMAKKNGIELCSQIRENPSVAHVPLILLTASGSDDMKLQGIEGGADDYIMKPFDKDMIVARVENILKGRSRLQHYFFDAVTLKPTTKIAGEHKEFIGRCISIVEDHLDDPDFTIPTFCKSIGMSHPSLYKKVKAVSGLTINVFIRYIRLRRAAELLITTEKTVTEVAYITGFNDIRYFREQFFELYQTKPSEYIKKYRRVLRGKTVKQ